MRNAYLGKTINCMKKVSAVFKRSEDCNRQFISMEFKRLVDLMNSVLVEEQDELDDEVNQDE